MIIMFRGAFASVSLAIMVGVAASAAPVAARPRDDQAGVILVSGGCGFAFHRDPFGVCVPNRRTYVEGPPIVRLPPPCPRGYHRDPDPARRLCYPNI